ncbi:MAG: ABC transporter substrate-binding protein [Chloroflexota bacterium]|nr:ABC transporter substrate-binding protein [Chloroflexota bacterium]
MALVVTSCAGGGTTSGKGPIVVGSKIDTEGALLSQVIIAMLKANGFQVVDKSQTGTTQVVRKALLSGEIDIYPEYTGNGAFFFSETESDVWKDAQKGYERVKQLDKEKSNVIWLQPAPANNTWAIAVPKSLADKERLKTLDDFAAYVNRGGYVKLAGSEEFVTSAVALPAFQKAYGFTLKSDQLVTLSGGNTALTEKAAAEGSGGVNTAMAYGTDGALASLGLVVLADPRGVQPVYEPAPIVRGEVFAKYPELATILDPVLQSLTLETLQTLNAKIAIEGQPAAEVARSYLTSKGFLK